jgi:hypothetical protein
VITKVDGEPVSGSPFRERLLATGFVAGYRGLVLRADRRPSSESSRRSLWGEKRPEAASTAAGRGARPH